MYDNLTTTMEHLLQKGKGILAADESITTIGKRLNAIAVENSEANRQAYRVLLATTPNLEKYINGVILFEETFFQQDEKGQLIPELFANKQILVGIKVDQGLTNLANTNNEKISQGLDGISERLARFQKLGAKFAKWRNVYSIKTFSPSMMAIKAGAETLARYAAICQSMNIIPIVEPEVLIDGAHSIEACAEASEVVLDALFSALFLHEVKLENIVLKPSMITAGKEAPSFSSPDEVAEYTLNVFRNHVPAAVPTINFLSGGQTPIQATANLNSINAKGVQPWKLSFSYGRALQEDCLKIWGGQKENASAAQEALLQRARLNSIACFGEYHSNMDTTEVIG